MEASPPIHPRRVASAILLVALAVASSFAAAMAVAKSLAVNSPTREGLIAEPAVIDFGRLQQGDQKSIQFKLVNVGKSPVKIGDLSPGCSFRYVTINTKHVPPGGAATLSLTWRVGTRRGDVTEGMGFVYECVAPVEPGRGDTPQVPMTAPRVLQVAVRASVAPEIDYSPKRIEFTKGQAGTVVVRLSPGTRPDFTVSKVAATSRAFAPVYDAPKREVVVSYSPTSETDFGRGIQVSVVTDGVREPTLNIPVVIKPGHDSKRSE